ncbi:hypothetical protein Purlil1_9164 [Purpureocillium lilacinum]|uniref:Uncharacterized protein n=1 Tax=Purpureocillium lilacinum TaxID=33203 RepID=A0ABR0BR74_PURLI|nr:hypothetical protein Purlil1_9164 [Purpureocillium lilacinum]
MTANVPPSSPPLPASPCHVHFTNVGDQTAQLACSTWPSAPRSGLRDGPQDPQSVERQCDRRAFTTPGLMGWLAACQVSLHGTGAFGDFFATQVQPGKERVALTAASRVNEDRRKPSRPPASSLPTLPPPDERTKQTPARRPRVQVSMSGSAHFPPGKLSKPLVQVLPATPVSSTSPPGNLYQTSFAHVGGKAAKYAWPPPLSTNQILRHE